MRRVVDAACTAVATVSCCARTAVCVLTLACPAVALSPSSKASSFEERNVAPSAAYTLSPKPNADFAPERTRRELTDGVRSSGRFWSSGQSVGWEKRSPVVFRQSFSSEVAVRRVEIGTGKNARSIVALPSHAMIYAAGEGGLFKYIGDAREPWQQGDALADGVTTLSLEFSPITIREIVIVFFRDSPFLFLDEIRIISAETGAPVSGTTPIDWIESHAVSWRRSEAIRRAGQEPLGSGSSERFAWPLPGRRQLSSKQNCLVTRISPWTGGTAQEILEARSTADSPSLHAFEGWLVAAFRVENNTSSPQKVKLNHRSREGVTAPRTLIANFTLALDYKWRADRITPTDAIILPANSFAMVLAEAQVSRVGDLHLDATVECGQGESQFSITGKSITSDRHTWPYGNLWSYLVGPVSNIGICHPDFHRKYSVDTAVINERALNRRLNKDAEALLRKYLRVFSNSRRILLYMEMTDASWPQGEDKSLLEKELTEWWNWVSSIIAQEGFKGSVALYPIDEVEPDQVRHLNGIVAIFRRIAPGVPLYGTIDSVAALQSADLDILQVLERIVPSVSLQMAQQREIHVYSAKHLVKTLSLSNHYRRLSWLAFGASFRGSGFWSMWDASGVSLPDLGWTDFGGSERDYSAVYGSADGCLYPSRRLMAWRRGIEDHAVLEACHNRSSEGMRLRVQSFIKEDRAPDDYDTALSTLVQSCID